MVMSKSTGSSAFHRFYSIALTEQLQNFEVVCDFLVVLYCSICSLKTSNTNQAYVNF